MSVLIIGGDNISPIRSVLSNLGVIDINHWSARNKHSITRKKLPSVDCLIMLTNFLNHNTMYKFKNEAKRRNIPFICATRNENSVNNEFCKKFGGTMKNEVQVNKKEDLIKQNGCTC